MICVELLLFYIAVQKSFKGRSVVVVIIDYGKG